MRSPASQVLTSPLHLPCISLHLHEDEEACLAEELEEELRPDPNEESSTEIPAAVTPSREGMMLVVIAPGTDTAQLLLPLACRLALQGNHVVAVTHRVFTQNYGLEACGVQVCLIGSDESADQVASLLPIHPPTNNLMHLPTSYQVALLLSRYLISSKPL